MDESARQKRIRQIVEDLIRRRDRDEEVSTHAILRDHPDLADELRGRLEALKFVVAAKEAVEPATMSNEGETQSLASRWARIPDTIGSYKILKCLGEGGMGVVYLAERTEPVHQRVAVKIIKRGMDTKQLIARFEIEREALALLNHPNIAKIFDAGASDDGLPYFVMEYVPGISITEYCDKHRLSLEDRLQLLIDVCRAVQHAHQRGIIHRDIKPSNVLVAVHGNQPTPKIIDFGVAKATQQLTKQTLFTEQGQLIGTPGYMSPEQAEMTALDIDTRTDVYSLGVLMYELLVGKRPFDDTSLHSAGLLEIQRIIREVDPPKPSAKLTGLGNSSSAVARTRQTDIATLTRQLRSDLDWVVMKCLEKDRTRRYDSPNDLALEISRYLSGEPVLAGPPSATYRIKKFVYRNKATVAAVSAVFFALVIGLSVSTVMYFKAATNLKRAIDAEALAEGRLAESENARVAEGEQRRLAEQRADELAKVTELQRSMFADVELEQMGSAIRSEQRRQYAESQKNQGGPLQRHLLQTLDRMLVDVNFTQLAQKVFDDSFLQPAVDAIRLAEQPAVQASLQQAVALTYQQVGLHDKALPLQKEALNTRRAHLGNAHLQTIVSMNHMATLLADMARHNEAIPLQREAVRFAQSHLGKDHVQTFHSVVNLASLLLAMGKTQEALQLAKEVAQDTQRVLGREHQRTVHATDVLASVMLEIGAYDDVLPIFRDAVDRSRRTYGNQHRKTIRSLSRLGLLYTRMGKYEEAHTFIKEALAGAPYVSATLSLELNELAGYLLSETGRYSDALPYFYNTLEEARKILGDTHPGTFIALGNLGELLVTMGEFDSGFTYLNNALSGNRHELGDGHPHTISAMIRLAVCNDKMGESNDAFALLTEAVETGRTVLGKDHPQTLNAMHHMGSLLARTGRHDEALSMLNDSASRRRQLLGNQHPDTLDTLDVLGRLLARMKKSDEAERLAKEALDGRMQVLGKSHPDVWESLNTVGIVQQALGEHSAALAFFGNALERQRSFYGVHHSVTKHTMQLLANLLTDARLEHGDQHIQTLEVLQFMGFALFDMEREGEARELFREALGGFRKVLGDEHQMTLAAMSNLGLVNLRTGELDEALELLQESLEKRCKVLGDDHPHTEFSVHAMGVALTKAGQFDDALPFMRDAVEHALRRYGNNHTESLVALDNMRLHFVERRQREGGTGNTIFEQSEEERHYEQLYDKASLARDETQDFAFREHPLASINVYLQIEPMSAHDFRNAGILSVIDGRIAEKVVTKSNAANAQHVIETHRNMPEEKGDDTNGPTLGDAMDLCILGDAYFYVDRLEESLDCYQEALDIERRFQGKSNLPNLESVEGAVRALSAMGRMGDAESLLRETFKTIDRKDVEPSGTEPWRQNNITLRRYLRIGCDLGIVLRKLGKTKEAEKQLRQVLEDCHHSLGAHEPLYIATLYNLGLTLASKGDRKNGESSLRQVITYLDQQLGETHYQTNKVRAELAKLSGMAALPATSVPSDSSVPPTENSASSSTGVALDYDELLKNSFEILRSSESDMEFVPGTNVKVKKRSPSIAIRLAGDVDNDGLEDLLATVGVEECYLIFGKPDFEPGKSLDLAYLQPSDGLLVISGRTKFDAVQGVGDVNGDGIDDMLFRTPSPLRNGEYTHAGAVHVVFGGEDLRTKDRLELGELDGSTGLIVNRQRTSQYDRFGISCARAGDVNGDGQDDILIGDPRSVGRVYLLLGGPHLNGLGEVEVSTLIPEKGFVIEGDQSTSFGNRVSSAGDLNDDGFKDFVVGAPFARPDGRAKAGQSWVVFGGKALGKEGTLRVADLDGTNGFVVNGRRPWDGGASYSGGGDLNHDGIDDLLIGIRQGKPHGKERAGETYVLFGSKEVGAGGLIEPSDLDWRNGFRIHGKTQNEYYADKGQHSGSTVAFIGDLNGDGIDDIAIGAPGAKTQPVADPKLPRRSQDLKPFQIGACYVVFGGPDIGAGGVLELAALTSEDGRVLHGAKSSVLSRVAKAGDINKDGRTDLLIGSRGRAYLFFGVTNTR